MSERIKRISVKGCNITADGRNFGIDETIYLPGADRYFTVRLTDKAGLHLVMNSCRTNGFRGSYPLKDGEFELSRTGCAAHVPVPKMDKW